MSCLSVDSSFLQNQNISMLLVYSREWRNYPLRFFLLFAINYLALEQFRNVKKEVDLHGKVMGGVT